MPTLQVQTFKLFRDFLSKKFGIEYDHSHLEQMENRIRGRVQQFSNGSFEDYLFFIKKNNQELEQFLSLISTNKTNFFRHPDQFHIFEDHLIPKILNKTQTGDEFRILSAGCSRGAELYSLLMICDRQAVGNKRKLSGLGLDICSEEIAVAISGQFAEENMLDIPSFYKDRYFTKIGNHYQLDKKIVQLAEFKFFNLMDPLIFPPFDVIFCRNCLIYFKDENKERITEELYRSLKIGGYLVLSPNEYIRNDFRGSLVEEEINGGHLYTKINPDAEVWEYHFENNRLLMKVMTAMQNSAIRHKFANYGPEFRGLVQRYLMVSKDFGPRVDKLLQDIEVKPQKKQLRRTLEI